MRRALLCAAVALLSSGCGRPPVDVEEGDVGSIEAECAPACYQLCVTDLGALPMPYDREILATAVNDSATVVGYSVGSGPLDTVAFVWTQASGIQELPALQGFPSCIARDINNLGVIVGSCFGGTSLNSRAVAWYQGQVIDLGLPAGFEACRVTGINDNLVGAATCWTGPGVDYTVFEVTQTAWTQLAKLDSDADSERINDAGAIVGNSATVAGPLHAAGWYGGAIYDINGGFAGSSAAVDINDSFQAVGYRWTTSLDQAQPILFTLGGNQVLPGLPGSTGSTPLALNDGAVIVGSAFLPGLPAVTAVGWYQGAVADLNDLIPAGSGIHLEFARDINANNQIAASGSTGTSVHSFLLTPCCD